MVYHIIIFNGDAMSKKVTVVLTLLLSFVLVFYGCKSKPEAEEETPVEEVAPMTEEEMLETARYNIEQAEKLKAEIDESGYADSDAENYNSAGQALTSAKAALGDEEKSADPMTAYTKSREAVDLYEKVMKKVKEQQEADRLAKEAEEEAARKAQAEKEKQLANCNFIVKVWLIV